MRGSTRRTIATAADSGSVSRALCVIGRSCINSQIHLVLQPSSGAFVGNADCVPAFAVGALVELGRQRIGRECVWRRIQRDDRGEPIREAANYPIRDMEELPREDEVELVATLAMTSVKTDELDAATAALEKIPGVAHATYWRSLQKKASRILSQTSQIHN